VTVNGGIVVEKIIIEERHYKATIKAVYGFFMLLSAMIIWLVGMKERKPFFWILGFVLTIFFAIRFLILYSKTRLKKPLLTITFDGIIDSSTQSVGYIKFIDIKDFVIEKIKDQEVIGIIPEEEESFIKQLSPNKQEIARNNVKLGYPPFTIAVENAKDMTLHDIYTLLKKRLKDYGSLYK